MVAKLKKVSQTFNKSYYYILPMFGKTWQELCYINNTYLFNNYFSISTEKIPYSFTITCFCDDPLIESMPEFICKEYNESKAEYVYLLSIPEQYIEDYLYFLLGKYSNFSEKYRKDLYKLLGKHYKSNNIYKVIERDEGLKKKLEDLVGESLDKEAELTSIYDDKLENYNG